MEISRQALEQRKEQLLKDKGELIATLQATDGAIQDCDYWLSVLEQETPAQ